MEKEVLYADRLNRVNNAIALKKTDRIPCIPFVATFPFLRQGHTMAQVLYDYDLAAEDNLKYHNDFEPDMAFDVANTMAGEGPILDILQPEYLRWSGSKYDTAIPDNSIHQFIEKAYLEDDEYPEILTDLTKWVTTKLLPRRFKSLECLKKLDFSLGVDSKPTPAFWISQFANEEFIEAFSVLSDAAKKYYTLTKKMINHANDLKAAGFPLYMGGGCTTAFDTLSDTLRGTIGTCMDLLDDPLAVHDAVNMFHERNIKDVHATMKNPMGKFFFIPLHKGFDGFMSPKQYEEFYYPTLKALVEEVIKCGGTPLVYTEGKYDSRLECLSDLPAGKVLIHIEDADMKEAKRILGKNHCLSGGFKSSILLTHTPDQIREEVKRFLDVVAVDGGYIFDLDYNLDNVSDAAVHAMFDAVKQYGTY